MPAKITDKMRLDFLEKTNPTICGPVDQYKTWVIDDSQKMGLRNAIDAAIRASRRKPGQEKA